MYGKIFLDFDFSITQAKRKCNCRYCKGIILKREKRVTESFLSRFGWTKHHYHTYCTARMLIETHRQIEKDIRKMLKIAGFIDDDGADDGAGIFHLLQSYSSVVAATG